MWNTEAEQHATEGCGWNREKIEVKNRAENMDLCGEKSLKDTGDKAPKELKEEIEKLVKRTERS